MPTPQKRQSAQGGFAIIMVLCIGALFVALATALMFAASMLVAGANRQLQEQQVYNLAASFSQRLDEELTAYSNLDDPDKRLKPGYPFAAYADEFLHDTVYRNVTGPQSYQVTGAPDIVADDIIITLTRQEDNDEITQGVVLEYNDEADLLKQVEYYEDENALVPDYRLRVAVTATMGEHSFTYTQNYDCKAHYNTIYYTFEGSNAHYTWQRGTTTFTTAHGETVEITGANKREITVHYSRDSIADITHTKFTNAAVDTTATDP